MRRQYREKAKEFWHEYYGYLPDETVEEILEKQEDRGRNNHAVFKTNLHKFARLWSLDLDGLAKSLRWTGADRRWLKRIWDGGLKHEDSRTSKRLTKLAKHFGIYPWEWWIPGVMPHPDMLDEQHHGYARYLWEEAVEEIMKITKWLPMLYLNHIDEIEAAGKGMKLRCLMTKLVRHCIAGEYIDPSEERILDLVNAYETKHSLPTVIHEMMWKWQDKSATELLDILRSPLTLDEAEARLEKRFGKNEFGKILDEIRAEREWKEFVDVAYLGEETDATAFIMSKWEQVKTTVDPTAFCSFIRTNVLSDYKPKSEDTKGLTIKKRNA